MNIENMWSEVKRTMLETWTNLSARNRDEIWALLSDEWEEFASYTRYIRSMIRVHDTTNEISGRSRGVLDFLLKKPIP